MKNTVKNWGETIEFYPKEIVYPNSVEGIRKIVVDASNCNKKIRMVGSRHSFSPLIETSDILMSLDQLQGIISIDIENETVEVYAGTKLHSLCEELHVRGYSLENMGDINVQSIAGALLTGTHGTGSKFGILSTQVKEFTVILANGDELIVNKENDSETFEAMGVSLGMLGIVVKLKVKIIKSSVFQYKSEKTKFEKLCESVTDYRNNYDHFEFFVFPFSDDVQVKTMKTTDEPPENLSWEKWKVHVLENKLFYVISECSRLIPKLSKYISKMSAKTVPSNAMLGYSHQLFATVREVKFAEMEYAVPVEVGMTVIREIRSFIESKNIKVHFPIECRFVKEDNFWLSPAFKRNSMYIAVHMYKGMEYKEYFSGVEKIFKKYNGKPHFGKINMLTKNELLQNYERASDFILLRRKLDPKNLFLNDYLSGLFF